MTDQIPASQTDTEEFLEQSIAPIRKEAVDAALKQDWSGAIAANLKILKLAKNDIASLNRLGFAYMNARDMENAKKVFEKVKKIDPYNAIAVKNLSKLSLFDNGKKTIDPCGAMVSPMMFLEDPGKTKIVQCVNIAPAQTLSTFTCGQEIFLKPKNHCVEVRDSVGTYLGALPDDLSFRLIKYLAGNNMYRIYIKAIDKKTLTVFIREVSRGKKFSNQPSFASSQLIQSYNRELPPDSTDSEKPDVTATGEDTETEEN